MTKFEIDLKTFFNAFNIKTDVIYFQFQYKKLTTFYETAKNVQFGNSVSIPVGLWNKLIVFFSYYHVYFLDESDLKYQTKGNECH